MWLIKSEPSVYSWDKLVEDKRTEWDGVRNHQANANLKAMRIGDRSFFYHSAQGLAIIGIAEIVRQAYPDRHDTTGRFVAVDIVPIAALERPVTLREIKQDRVLRNMAIVRQPRLSVSRVSLEEWERIVHLGCATFPHQQPL